MSEPVLFVVSCDANFFDFVQGTILSLRLAIPGGEQTRIGFLDCGCTPEQLDWLRQHVDLIQPAAWDFSFPGRDKAPAHLKALLVRPWLPRYFPGFEVYCWLDADTWVEDGQALALFLQGARQRRGLAIVPELDRGQLALQYGGLPGAWSFHEGLYRTIYGEDVARKLHSCPMLNDGVFAMHRDAPHWSVWREHMVSAVPRLHLLVEQLTLNAVVYFQFFAQTELLPLWCNWTCHSGLPGWDKQQQRLVEPYLPHQPIGIVHLTGLYKPERPELRCTDGDWIPVRLRYPVQAGSARTGKAPVVSGASLSLQGALAQAEQLFRVGRLEEMESLCRSILEANPRVPDAHRFLGLIAYSHSRFADAETHVRQALSLAPKDAPAYDNLSLILLAQGRAGEAELAARKALTLHPRLPNAWRNLEQALRMQGRFAEVEELLALHQSFGRQPNNPEVRNKLERLLKRLDRSEASLALPQD